MPIRLDYEDYDLGGQTWQNTGITLKTADFVVLPVGSFEQHSHHLPLSVDTLRAETLTQILAEAAEDRGLSFLRLPTLPYGYSEHHMPYSGTITLFADTYQSVVEEIGMSLATHGAPRFCIVNFHGGNTEPLKLAADRIQRDHGLRTYPLDWTDYAREELEEVFGQEWGHAGEYETSVIELFYPELVKDEKKEIQTRRANYEVRPFEYFDDITEQGGIGDPTNSDSEIMDRIITDATERILDALEADMESEQTPDQGDGEAATK